MTNFNIYDYARDLSHHHAIFYKIMELGNPIFDEGVRTACIVYNKDTKRLMFVLNREFFEALNRQTQLFTLCHEAMHILFEHPFRLVEKELDIDIDIANIAQDIVINELLLREYGFFKESLNFGFDICLVDIIFDKTQIEKYNITKEMTFMEYYDILEKEMEDNKDFEEKMKGGSFSLDEHQPPADDGVNSDGNSVGEVPMELLEDLIDSASTTLTKEEKKTLAKSFGKGRGEIESGEFHAVKVLNQTQQKVWQDLVKAKIKSVVKKSFKQQDSFMVEKRNFAMLDKGFMIPGESELPVVKQDKYNLYFFMDVSGSCFDYKDEFFNIVKTVPEEFFNVRLFSFDMKVVELDIKSPKVYGGGGTKFDIIEAKIQETLLEGDKKYQKYPDLVMVLSDGDGNRVKPEKPKNWTWLLTSKDLRFIDELSGKIMLSDLKKKISLKI